MTINLLEYPEARPMNQNHPAERLVAMLHGVGSDGNDLIALAPFFAHSLQNAHFISPNGVEEYDMAPFGRQWFSLLDRDPKVLQEKLSQNVPDIMEIIKDKQQKLNLSNKDTILIGFSQGSVTSIFLTLSQEEAFAATIAFSGRLITPKEIKNVKTPICVISGEDDDVVPSRESKDICDFLAKHKIDYQSLFIPNLAHSIDMSGINFAVNFLQTKLK
jgi:phospholipase/carboxylesterase